MRFFATSGGSWLDQRARDCFKDANPMGVRCLIIDMTTRYDLKELLKMTVGVYQYVGQHINSVNML